MESIRNEILTIVFGVEIIKYWIGISIFGNVKIVRKWIVVPSIIVYRTLVYIMNLEFIDQHLLLYAMVYFILSLTVQVNIKEKVKILSMSMVLIVCLDEILGIFADSLLAFREGAAIRDSISICLASILSLCIISILAVVKQKTKIFDNIKFQIFIKNSISWIMIILIVYLMFLIVGVNYLSNYIENEKFTIFVNLVSIISLICIFMITGFIFYIKEMNQRLNRMVQAEHKLREMQLKQYKILLDRELDTRKYRHDMKNHFQCMIELSKSSRKEAVVEYIEDLGDEIAGIGNKVYDVGNETLNAILNYHLSQLASNVRIEVNGKCTRELRISNVDLCTIFANLIQNAVEELEKNLDTESYLRVKIKSGQEFFDFEIVNNILEDDKVRIKKVDAQNHGFGLGNVKRVVEKHHGFFSVKVERKEFQAKVILKI